MFVGINWLLNVNDVTDKSTPTKKLFLTPTFVPSLRFHFDLANVASWAAKTLEEDLRIESTWVLAFK